DPPESSGRAPARLAGKRVTGTGTRDPFLPERPDEVERRFRGDRFLTPTPHDRRRVSVRTVRRELGGGAFGDIARELRKWKDREDYRPAIERADSTEGVERRLTVMGPGSL
ncbi:hypothetical protein OY671_012377, partial [Metschnikowia pulcherrima]